MFTTQSIRADRPATTLLRLCNVIYGGSKKEIFSSSGTRKCMLGALCLNIVELVNVCDRLKTTKTVKTACSQLQIEL